MSLRRKEIILENIMKSKKAAGLISQRYILGNFSGTTEEILDEMIALEKAILTKNFKPMNG